MRKYEFYGIMLGLFFLAIAVVIGTEIVGFMVDGAHPHFIVKKQTSVPVTEVQTMVYKPVCRLYRIDAEYINLREAPNASGKVIAHMMGGVFVPIDKFSYDNKWAFSELYHGWVSLDFLTKIPENEYNNFVFCVEDTRSGIIYDNLPLRVYNNDTVRISDKLYVPLEPHKWYIHLRDDIEPDKSAINYTDINKPTNISLQKIHSLCKGTGLEGIELAVKELEVDYGINALYTISVAAHESGWGNSHLAKTRNNLFGIAAFDDDISSAMYFNSKYDCVKYWGKMIKNDYFDKGLTTTQSINTIYASDKTWSSKVNSIMKQCYYAL